MAGMDPDAKIPWLNDMIASTVRSPFELIAGIAEDDCAVLDLDERSILVVTSDYVNAQPMIITLGLGSYFELGRYLVNCILADLCGSGAEPLAILTSIMWNREEAECGFEQLMRGAKAAATAGGVAIVGG